MAPIWVAFGLGLVAGLRTFTAPAALFFPRGGVWAILLAVAALGEYIVDALPQTPSRTLPPAVAARIVSGAFCGWTVSAMHDASGVAGAVAGIIGALLGTYAGHAARLDLIARVQALPAAVVEDGVAIGLAALLVTRG